MKQDADVASKLNDRFIKAATEEESFDQSSARYIIGYQVGLNVISHYPYLASDPDYAMGLADAEADLESCSL